MAPREAMPVKSMPQKKTLTGAHCRAVRREKGGYGSTHPIRFERETATTATKAWETTRRMLSVSAGGAEPPERGGVVVVDVDVNVELSVLSAGSGNCVRR